MKRDERVPTPVESGQMAPEGECKFCDDMRAKGTTFFPRHKPSSYCLSGKRPHCTCDWCF